MWNIRTEGQLTKALQNVQWGFNLDEARQQTPAQIEAKALAFVETLHSWGHADVAAFLTYEMRDHKSATLAAAQMIDGWQARGLVYTSGPITPVVEAVQQRRDCAAQLVHDRIGLKAKFTSEAELKVEAALHRSAKALAEKQGQRLAVEVQPWMSEEQVSAISLMARGMACTCLTGVAGAGKTTIMEPVAKAAHHRGMTVFSVARNAARAQDTGAGIKADRSMSIAALLGQDIDKLGRNKPILLCVDEAGVVDREDLHRIMALAEKPGARVQIVFCGDRDQAQSIDRKGAFALVQAGAAEAGQHLHLSKSYRNAAWEAEATHLRQGVATEVAAAAKAEGRVHRATTQDYAEIAADKIAASEGMTALVMTNSEFSGNFQGGAATVWHRGHASHRPGQLCRTR